MNIKRPLPKARTMKNMRMKRIGGSVLLLALLVSLTSCATIMQGERREVSFNSEPQGADVYINGILFGRTPVLLQLKAGQSCVAEFRKEGYRTEVRQLKSRIKAGWLVLDVICGTLPLIVDAVTGSWNDFRQHHFNVVIERVETDGEQGMEN